MPGQFVFVAGEGNTVRGRDAFSAGVGNTVSGEKAAAFNDGNTASGADSFAIGQSTEASNEQAFAQGHTSKASGKRSVAMGIKSEATNDNTIAIGNVAHAYGTNAIAIGRNVTANNNNSMAMGYNATANADNSVAIGLAVTADANAQFVAGKYNKANNSAIFVVGAGRNDSDRENAIEVYSKTSGADPTVNIKGGFEVNSYDQRINIEATGSYPGLYIESNGDYSSAGFLAKGTGEASMSIGASCPSNDGIVYFYGKSLYYSPYEGGGIEPAVRNYYAVLNDNGESTTIARIFGTDITVTLNATGGGSGVSGTAVTASGVLKPDLTLDYGGSAKDKRYAIKAAGANSTKPNSLYCQAESATATGYGVVKVAAVRNSAIRQILFSFPFVQVHVHQCLV